MNNTTNGTTIGIKASYVPGEVREFAVTLGTTVGEVLELANMDTTGYDIRLDGESVQSNELIVAGSKAITLVKQVKGNADGTIKVSYVPGEVKEYAIPEGTTIKEVLDMASMSYAGYDVRVDGETMGVDETIEIHNNAITLVKQVKGNSSFEIKASYVPGEVKTFSVEEGCTIGDVLSLANMDSVGFDIRLDGETKDASTELYEGDRAITLVKQVKGNK